MSELTAALQRLADRADDAAMPSPAAVRVAGEQRTRRAALTATGLALAAFAAVVVALAMVSGASHDDSVPPADLTHTPSASGGAPSQEWETLRPDWGVSYMDQHSVAARGSTFVAVGDTSGDTSHAGRDGTPIWWSHDGRTWTRATGVASINVTDVIATDVGFLATGIDGDGAAAFRSEDGTTWAETLDLPKRGALWGVADTDSGYFAWGHVGNGPALYRSDDGRTWTATDLKAPTGQATRLCAVEDSAAGGLTAFGGVRNGRSGPENLATWSSADGTTWNLTEVTSTDANCNLMPEAHWSATTGVGTIRIEPYGEPGLLYFRSAD